jgi:pimeloyl-ACP methyl ester carboxylesterase
MIERHVSCLNPRGFHRMAYTEWGDAANRRVVVCVHGLTRQGRDFDALADALSGGWRVVCPDVVGRGRSDWLAEDADYAYPQYIADMTALIARLGVDRVDWVGTSMGGLIGMMLAAQPGSPIRRLVVNDVGPYLPEPALRRIAAYIGEIPRFPDVAAAETHFRAVHAPFGPLSDAQWRHLTVHGIRPMAEGGWRPHYDPKIGDNVRLAASPIDLWSTWDRIGCPVLALRGAESDLLLAETAHEMTRRGPRAEFVEFSQVGHAPALMDPIQIETVREWLEGP